MVPKNYFFLIKEKFYVAANSNQAYGLSEIFKDILTDWKAFSILNVMWLKQNAPVPSSTVLYCSFANFINAADRVIMPIALLEMSKEFDYTLHQQGYILSAFPLGYISSQVSYKLVTISEILWPNK